MTYDELYPNAHEFEEVIHLLFKQLISYRCSICRTSTMWCTYKFNNRPMATCSPNCTDELIKMARDYLPSSR